MNDQAQCKICRKYFRYGFMYDYRGAISCEACFDKLIERRDNERVDIDRTITSDSHITRILSRDIPTASKESRRQKDYNQNKHNHD